MPRFTIITLIIILIFCLPFHSSKEYSIQDYGLRKKGVKKHQEIIFVHIPKTAGMSFRFTINNHGKFGAEHTEKCYVELYEKYIKKNDGEPFSVAFFRSPRAHVLSQFLECKYDNWGKRVTKGTEFPRHASDRKDFEVWVNYFYDSWNKKNENATREIELDSFHCYHPYNLQSRAMSDDCIAQHYLSPTQSTKGMGIIAIENMMSLTCVGITELYAASLCLFWVKAGHTETMDLFCNPALESYYSESHVTHHVPEHKTSDIHEGIWKKVDKMTLFDLILYQNAVVRFLHEFDRLVTKARYSKVTVCSFKNMHVELIISAFDKQDSHYSYVMTTLKKCLD